MTRNTKTCLAFTPLWSIAYSLSFFYLSLYFRACGVSDSQLGSLVTLGAASSIIFSFLSAPLVDRMGRRRSTLVFDLVGSAAPFLIFAFSGNFAAALVGTVLSNSARVMNIGFSLLMTEDSGNDERSTAFNVFNIMYIASGLLVPVAGSYVERAGILGAERWFLILSAAVLALSAIGRSYFTVETRTGLALMEKTRVAAALRKPRLPADPGALFRPYATAFRFLGSDRGAAAAASANLLFYVYYSVGTIGSFYFAPFFADALGMDSRMMGLVGAVFSAGTLFSMLVLNPILLKKLGARRCSVLGGMLNLGGFLPLVFLRPGNGIAAILAVGGASLGYGMIKSGVDAALSTCFGEGLGATEGAEEARAGVYSITNIVSSALVMGSGALFGAFYDSAPRLIPLLSTLFLGAIVVILLEGGGRRRASPGTSV
ncbi:MAG: MFS transporter [Spirochaetes bacterium]|nr:MFS transporter [Spirochaetota bacterium]